MMARLLYRVYRLFHSLQAWSRLRFTPAGWLALAACAASAVLGLDTRQSMAYQAFTFLAALLLCSMAASLLVRGRLAVRRVLPRYATVGETLAYAVEVRNETPRAQRGLLVVEEPDDPRPSLPAFVSNPEPGERGRNWFDRKMRFHRWMWLISRKRGAEFREAALPDLAPGETARLRLELKPLRRGPLRLAGVTVAVPDPLGLFKAVSTRPAGDTVLVLHRRYPVPRLALPGVRRWQPGGVALASSVGESDEFVSLRDYRPGDPLRRIHWRSWPKAGRPIVKEFQDERFVRHALVLDTFTDSEYGEAFEEAVSVAASFAVSILTQESLLDLLFVGNRAYCFTAGRGLSQADRLLEILACARACRDKPFAELKNLVLQRRPVLSGCVLVLLAWDEERRRFVEELRSLGVPVLALVVEEAGGGGAAPGPFFRLEPGRIAEGLARVRT